MVVNRCSLPPVRHASARYALRTQVAASAGTTAGGNSSGHIAPSSSSRPRCRCRFVLPRRGWPVAPPPPASATAARCAHKSALAAAEQPSSAGCGAVASATTPAGTTTNGCTGMVCIVATTPPGSLQRHRHCCLLHASAICVDTVAVALLTGATTVDAATNTTATTASTSTATIAPTATATERGGNGCCACWLHCPPTAAAIAPASISIAAPRCRPVGPCRKNGNQAPHWKRRYGRVIAVV